MQTFTDIRTAHIDGPTVLTIGNFDGIHRGHQVLLQELQQVAATQTPASSARTAVITFDPHPITVLRPDVPLKLLTTPQERMLLAGQLGIEIGIIQPFTADLAALGPAEFIAILKEHLGLSALVVGPDFALGRDRAGNLDVLSELGTEYGYTIHVIEPIEWHGESVRSSHIRRLIGQGRVADAAPLLGRFYHVSGIVEEGDHRGRQIGVPTANLHVPADKLLPSDGVYATYTWLTQDGLLRRYGSVTNLGNRPTVDGLSHRVETHILDFPRDAQDGDLYSRKLTVQFVQRLREERRFAGIDELVAQIQRDIAAGREILSATTPSDEPFVLHAPAIS